MFKFLSFPYWKLHSPVIIKIIEKRRKLSSLVSFCFLPMFSCEVSRNRLHKIILSVTFVKAIARMYILGGGLVLKEAHVALTSFG